MDEFPSGTNMIVAVLAYTGAASILQIASSIVSKSCPCWASLRHSRPPCILLTEEDALIQGMLDPLLGVISSVRGCPWRCLIMCEVPAQAMTWRMP